MERFNCGYTTSRVVQKRVPGWRKKVASSVEWLEAVELVEQWHRS
jgi:hypothetical protein